MKNKWLKKGLIFLVSGCLILSMTGCSQIQHLKDQVLGKAAEEKEEEKTEETEVEEEPEVEVAKPEWKTNLSGSVTYKVGDTAEALKVEATTSDEGTITYQWYQSSTNKNGGGTPIEGATENTYVPSTEEEGTMYYYVVATSTIGNSENGVTSNTAEVIVTADGSQEGEEQEQAADNQNEAQEEENTQENQG